MLTVLLLTGVEKLINFALSSDKITQAGLHPLSGKVLRLNMQTPKISLDVLFNEDHVRFEPVSTGSVFEPKGSDLYADIKDEATDSSDFASSTANLKDRQQARRHHTGIGHDTPDCTINVANAAELLNLMRAPEGNLPIEGDYKVLMQVKQLVAGFDPDIAGQLEPLIGTALASQLGLLINHLKGSVKQTAKHTFADVSDWANEVAGNAKIDPEQEAEVNDLKQQLLKLRADVEREEARLAMIKAEQQKYRQQ